MKLRMPDMFLIDLDGTLIDTVPDLAYCADMMLQKLDMPARGEERVREWVGNGVERLVRRALINQLEGEPEEALFQKAYPLFLELYAEHTSERSRPFPGVREGLEYLKATGRPMGCVTNKAARFTEPLLEDLNFAGDFSLTISGDSLPKKKPDPLPLLHAAEHFQVDPKNCLLIGDSISDVKAARAAGFAIVCVAYGYNHGQDIRTADPDAVIDSFAELRSLFAQAA